jgi:hypothetical protein
MTTNDVLESLRFFNEIAVELLDFSFTKPVRSEKTSFSSSMVRRDDGLFDVSCDRIGPSAEQVAAFCNNLRFFIQDNKGCSIRKLSAVYSHPSIPANLRSEFEDVRTSLNRFLNDVPNDFHLMKDGSPMSRWKMIETYVYGRVSAQTKRQDYRRLVPEKFSEDFLDFVFISLLSKLTIPIGRMLEINDRTLSATGDIT